MPASAMINAVPLGARYMLGSALAFALMGACVKFAGARGIPVLEIIAARALISLVLVDGDVRRKGIPALGTHRLLLFSRGLVGFIALTGVYYALVHLPIAEASVLQYLHPMFTALIALLWLKERPTTATSAAVSGSRSRWSADVTKLSSRGVATAAPCQVRRQSSSRRRSRLVGRPAPRSLGATRTRSTSAGGGV